MKQGCLLILIAVLAIAGCESKVDPNEPQGFLQVKGSDTKVNATQKISEEFMKVYPHVFVAITGGGSGVGIASLINKTCDIAAASRDMKQKEIEMANKRGVSPNEIVAAFDGVAVVVNKNNPIDKLTISDLHEIYTGKAKSWSRFGGKDIPIVVLSREVSSGTYEYFKEEVIHLGDKKSKEEFSPSTLLLSSSQAIVEEVSSNESAIGYMGMGYISERTKALMISKKGEFFPPDVEHVQKRSYPLSRPLYFYTNGEPEGVTKLFVDFSLSEKGQQQFEETGFVPLNKDAAEKN